MGVVAEEEFPDGLRCGECQEDIEPGEIYMDQPVGMTGPDPVVLLVCERCGGK